MSEETTGVPASPSGVAELDLKPALEAVLMVVDEPATEEHLAKILQRPRRRIADALRELADEYTVQGRGFELRLIAGGWRFYSRPEFAPAVEGFVLDGQQARLTQAALETLAVVAYRQPVSRSRVSMVRGVNCDGVMRTLLQRGLVEEAGTEPETGAILYVTTNYFLERMGLREAWTSSRSSRPSSLRLRRSRRRRWKGSRRSIRMHRMQMQTTRRRRNFDAKQWQW